MGRDNAELGEGSKKHQLMQVAAVFMQSRFTIEMFGARPFAKIGFAKDRQIPVAIKAMTAVRIPG